MSRKAFLVQVELDVQAVTCPGVWLCSNGRVSLQVYMLDSCVQTASYKPYFPIKCEEKFVFSKTFATKHRLNDLQKQLHEQWIYIEFVQWQNCELGNVLSTFQTTLDELLFPSSCSGSAAGVDLDLLMEPTQIFPGTIAPKVEVSTKTTIEETICMCSGKQENCSTVVINPKVLISSEQKSKKMPPRKVCHSLAYSQRHFACRSIEKPPFRYKKVEDDLILRKPKNALAPYDDCSCRRRSRSQERRINCGVRLKRKKSKKTECPIAVRMCACGSGHQENSCPVCAKYRGYFQVNSNPCSPERRKDSLVRTNLFGKNVSKFSCPTQNLLPLVSKSSCCRPTAVALKNYAESDRKVLFCNCDDLTKRPSLAEKLHTRLTSTLNSLSCTDYEEEESGGLCDCECDLQEFYGNLYNRSRNKIQEYCQCVPDNRNRQEENRQI